MKLGCWWWLFALLRPGCECIHFFLLKILRFIDQNREPESVTPPPENPHIPY